MEKTMSIEDKIKRAEEIYYRRRNQDVPSNYNIRNVKKEKSNFKLLKKTIKQLLICILIYASFYIIANNNYIFSEDFTNKAKEILEQDINFSEIYSFIMNYIKQENKTNENQETIENNENLTNIVEETVDEPEMTKEEIQNNEENIGGAEELVETNTENIEEKKTEETEQETQELSQMEQDAQYLKSTISFIKPVEGTISSMFGLRNPTTASVPKNHTGTDIAAVTGTKIISSTDGTVILAENRGDYGKHIKIQINDAIILYAHCDKLYVKEGDSIKQGQEIGEVGSTGNTTGPHLHFEVRYQDRYIDPQLILEL